MFPLTFDNSTRPTGLDATNLFSAGDSAAPDADSFQSHLQLAPAATPPAPAARQAGREPPTESDASQAAAQPPAAQDQADHETPESSGQDAGVTSEESQVESSDESADAEDEEDSALVVATPTGAASDAQQVDAVLVTSITAAQDVADAALTPDATAQTDAPVELEQPVNATALFASELTQAAEREAQSAKTLAKQIKAAAETSDEVAAEAATTTDHAGGLFEGAAATAEPTKAKESARRSSTHDAQADQAEGASGEPTPKLGHPDPSPSDPLVPHGVERKTSPDTPQQPDQAALTPTTARGNDDAISPPTVSNRFAQHWLARGTERSSQADSLPEIDQTRFIDRVARAFQAAEGRDGVLRLRLSPPELGALRLELKMHEGALTAHIEAETPTAKALLLEHLPMLRERLAEQGVRIDQFDVDLLDRHFGQTPDRPDQQEPGERHGRRATAGPVRTDSNGEGSLPAARPTYGSDGRLNVIV